MSSLKKFLIVSCLLITTLMLFSVTFAATNKFVKVNTSVTLSNSKVANWKSGSAVLKKGTSLVYKPTAVEVKTIKGYDKNNKLIVTYDIISYKINKTSISKALNGTLSNKDIFSFPAGKDNYFKLSANNYGSGEAANVKFTSASESKAKSIKCICPTRSAITVKAYVNGTSVQDIKLTITISAKTALSLKKTDNLKIGNLTSASNMYFSINSSSVSAKKYGGTTTFSLKNYAGQTIKAYLFCKTSSGSYYYIGKYVTITVAK